MPLVHRIQPGEGITLLAERYGFLPETIWEDPANAALRESRTDMNVLLPGDEVVIPDRRLRTEICPTGARHVFRRRGIPAKYRLQILDNGTPVPDAPYRLTVDGRLHEGRTDSEGVLEHFIPPASCEGELVVRLPRLRKLRRKILFGQLAPLSDVVGVQQRLANLGYLAGADSGTIEEATIQALRAFQNANGLPVTGQADEVTLTRLEEIHGTRKADGGVTA